MGTMFNHEHFNEFLGWAPTEMIIQILDDYLESYESRLDDLEKYISELDFAKVKFYAHSYKNQVMYFSPIISRKSEKLSEKGKNNDSEGLTELMNEIKAQTFQLVPEILELKQKLQEKA